ncbi:MAG TPA: BlaI/MecI/CopY family transcriptional regulator [Gemmataceae bacterium]|nr:BlaI/MecI/CopY family transcriptional regulator [Gemmataceae bacterium]
MDGLPTPTARELQILKVLWGQGPSSVRAVHTALIEEGEDGLAYNTVQTMLRVMEAKQLVAHHTDGRTFIYSPHYSREESAARFLDRVFDGAASELMLTLIRAERVPADELDRMQALIAAARGDRRNGGAA